MVLANAGNIMEICMKAVSRTTSITVKANLPTRKVATTTVTGKMVSPQVTQRRCSNLKISTRESSSRESLMVTVNASTRTVTDTKATGRLTLLMARVLFTTRPVLSTLVPGKRTRELRVTLSSLMVVNIGVTMRTKNLLVPTREDILMVPFLKVSLSMVKSTVKAPIPLLPVPSGKETSSTIFSKVQAPRLSRVRGLQSPSRTTRLFDFSH